MYCDMYRRGADDGGGTDACTLGFDFEVLVFVVDFEVDLLASVFVAGTAVVAFAFALPFPLLFFVAVGVLSVAVPDVTLGIASAGEGGFGAGGGFFPESAESYGS